MGLFELIAASVVLGGVLAALYALAPAVRPLLRPARDTPPLDLQMALARLRDRVVLDDDDPRPWSDEPLRPGEERLPPDLRPWNGVAWVDGERPAVLPLGPCLFAADGGELLVGRRQGRPIQAVRLRPGVYLDLYEATRLLPVLLVELEARGLLGPIHLTDAAPEGEAEAVAPWLISGEGPRIVPEDEARDGTLTIEGHPVRLRVWMPEVADGLREDALRWAGEVQFGAHRSTGATSPEVLAALAIEPGPTVGWTRRELLELAGIMRQLEAQDVDLSSFLLEAFADRVAPRPEPACEDDRLLVAALLNWVGATHRRAGRPRTALAVLDAALRACGPEDDDNIADIHHNRGLCWIDLRNHDPEALAHAWEAFELSARHQPADAAPWIQMALVQHLHGDHEAAAEAWLQAASRAPPEQQPGLLENARAAERRDPRCFNLP